MKVRKTITAGQQGSQKYLRIWGKQLLNVRYRENIEAKTILTTIEIIVDERPLPPPGVQQRGFLAAREKNVVGVKINFDETDLRQKVKDHGGQWSTKNKLWFMSRQQAIALGLKDRIAKVIPSDCPEIDIPFNMRHGHI